MRYHILISLIFMSLVATAQAAETNYESAGESWAWTSGGDEASGGSSYLGVDIADVSSERLGALKLKEEHGAEVTMVDQDAPAGKAGLHEHDVILTLNGAAVESAAQLRRMIRETPPGRVVTLGISRDGQPVTVKVQLASRGKAFSLHTNPGDFNLQIPPMPPMPDFDVPVSIVIAHSSMRSGLMVENLTPQLGDFFGVKNGKGVLVRSVEKGSRADKSGLRAGDVIVKVNDQSVHDASDFTHALRSSSGGSSTITVVRDKKEQTLTLTLPDKKDSGALIEEDSFEIPDLTAETEQEVSRMKDQIALIQPAIDKARLEGLLSQQKQLQNTGQQKQLLQEKVLKQLQDSLRKAEKVGGWAEI